VKSIIRSFALAGACLCGLLIPAFAQSDELALRQITTAISSIGVTVRGVSYDGQRIVFDSTNDYTGENADGNNEIFVYDLQSARFIQITKTENIKDPADTTKITLNVSNNAPYLSGDGNNIVFTSNAKLTSTANDDGNQEVYLATLPRGATTPTFTRITDTDKNADDEVVKEIFNNYQATVNADGTVIAFVSTRRTFRALENGTAQFTASLEGANRTLQPDGNGEIFLYQTTTKQYSQVTISRDEEATDGFTVRGFNGPVFLSGNGQTMAFVSGFNYPGANANMNADFNGEIYLYRVGDPGNTFRQLTNTTGTAAVPAGAVVNMLASFTRPFNFAGTRFVFESAGDFAGTNADKTREVYLADLSGAQPTFRQVTNQTTADAAVSDFAFLPNINGDGTLITFNSKLNLVPTSPSGVNSDNADGSKEVFVYDIAASTTTTPKYRQLTFTSPATFIVDQRVNTTFAYINNAGNQVIFYYTAFLLSPNLSATPEIFEQRILPITATNAATLTLANAASFDNTQVARTSIASIFGMQLANQIVVASTATLPFELGGVRVTVNGLAAQLIFVSPGQINFIVPTGIAEGDMVAYTVNNNGLRAAGTAKIISAAPGIFTVNSQGTGTATAQCGAIIDVMVGDMTTQQFVFSDQPCDVGTAERANYLIIYGTGWRNQSGLTTVTVGGEVLTPIYAAAQGTFPGLDQINVALTQTLKGKGEVDVIVTSNSVASKPVKVTIK
jgi:uncharacterized protein (TIGR03437 family)